MRRCVFCGGPANSREHAWPEWVISLFRNQEEATIIAEREGEEPREWHGLNVSVKVKRFCHRCNTGWMSDLENEVRPLLLPLIRGESTTLDGTQRIVVATWCLKTAMVFDLTRTDKNIAFLPSERAYLYEARGRGGLGSPFPPRTFIWVASYQGSRFAMSAILSELRGSGDFSPTKRGHPIEANVVTLLAGSFVAQILVARLPPEADSQPPKLHEGAATWERASVPIWPLVGTRTSLPPALVLNDKRPTLDDFAFRWPKVTTNPRRRKELDKTN